MVFGDFQDGPMSKILNISRDVLQKQGGTLIIEQGWGSKVTGSGGSLRLLILQSKGLVA